MFPKSVLGAGFERILPFGGLWGKIRKTHSKITSNPYKHSIKTEKLKMLGPSYDQPLQKLCFWNDCKNRGLGTLGVKFWRFLSYKNIKINYKNRGFANLTTSILQKYSISNKKSAARGRFFWKNDWDCRIFDRSYFFLGHIKETPCIYIYIYIYMLTGA